MSREEKNNKKEILIKILKIAGRSILVFAVTMLVLFGLLCLTSLISHDSIKDNIKKSAEYMYENEGDFYQRVEGDNRTLIHDFADAVWLNIAYAIDDKKSITDTINTPVYFSFNNQNGTQTEFLYDQVNTDRKTYTIYDRYWHGMLVILRPLLVFMDISQIRLLITIILFVMLAVLCILLWIKGERELPIMLVIGAVVIRFHMLGQCLEYSPSWLVGLAFAIAAVFMGKKELNKVSRFFIISGVCCAFFDFLTTETITLLLPLMVLLCMQYKEKTLDNFIAGFKTSIVAGVSWLGAYAFTFISKWTIASIAANQNRFSAALEQASYRQGGSASKGLVIVGQSLLALESNLKVMICPLSDMTENVVTLCCVGALLAIAAFVYLFRKTGESFALQYLLYLIAIVPIIRLMVLNNHSLMHTFFTYRILFVTVTCVLTASLKLIDFDLLFGKKKAKKIKKRK